MTTDAVRASFVRQADHCDAMGSPLTARVLRLVVAQFPSGPVADRVLGWKGDPTPAKDAVALRLAAGLHALVLSGADAPLSAAYANPHIPDSDLQVALHDAIARHGPHLLRWLDSPPQTNEVRRSAALIAAGHWLARRFRMPLVLSELGASAGLNLVWDRYALDVRGTTFGPRGASVRLSPDWTGPLPPVTRPRIAARAGVDLNPLDPVKDRLRLLSYIWAGQEDRLSRTVAAAEQAARFPGLVEKGDAVDWLEGRLKTRIPGHLHLIFHTVAWQYFPDSAQVRGNALLAQAGAQATEDAPLAQLSMEADEQSPQMGVPQVLLPGARLSVTLWPEGQTILLGRVDFHGRWVDWQAP